MANSVQFIPSTYRPTDFRSPLVVAQERQNAYLRPAVVLSTNADNGTVNIEWLDHPGARADIPVLHAGQGLLELPTPGSVVLMGFDKAYQAYIVRYIQPGYRALVDNGTIWKMRPGEKMLVSYVNEPLVAKQRQYVAPSPTGTYLHLANTGNIFMTTADGDYWQIDRKEQTIEQYSLNQIVRTEAGILDFGLMKRQHTDGLKIMSTGGSALNDPTGAQEALTEFRLRLLETADGNLETPPALDNPFIELVLGTKLNETLNADGTKQYDLAATDATYAGGAGNEIMIQLRTKAEQGFEFTVDKAGNLTVKVTGNVKLAVDQDSVVEVGENFTVNVDNNSSININGDADISIGGDLTADVEGDVVFQADNINMGNGSSLDKKVVLSSFLQKFNQHTHYGNTGAPTSVPISRATDNDLSQKTRIG